MMHGEVATTLQCVDCGKSAERTSVSLHPGAVSAPSDEGHVRRTTVALCDEDRAGDLAAVLGAMSMALRPTPVPGAVDQFIETAAAHGARRRAQGVHEACLFEEYDHLGSAVPHGLRACEIAPLAPEDLLALEGGLTTAILAGLRGFHRGEFERRGTWEEVLARAAGEVTQLDERAVSGES